MSAEVMPCFFFADRPCVPLCRNSGICRWQELKHEDQAQFLEAVRERVARGERPS